MINKERLLAAIEENNKEKLNELSEKQPESTKEEEGESFVLTADEITRLLKEVKESDDK